MLGQIQTELEIKGKRKGASLMYKLTSNKQPKMGVMETSMTPEAPKVPVSVLNTESTLVDIKLKANQRLWMIKNIGYNAC